MNFDDALAKAALPERTEKVCLNAALLAELEQAERLADAADRVSKERTEAGSEMATDRAKVRKLRKAADDLKTKVDEQAITLRLRSLGFAAYNALLLKHPPRKDNDSDKVYGFNTLTFFPELVRACMIDPSPTDEQYEQFLSVVNDRTWDRIARAALTVNRGEDASVPF